MGFWKLFLGMSMMIYTFLFLWDTISRFKSWFDLSIRPIFTLYKICKFALYSSNNHLRSVSPKIRVENENKPSITPAWDRLSKPRYISPNITNDCNFEQYRDRNRAPIKLQPIESNTNLTLSNQSKTKRYHNP